MTTTSSTLSRTLSRRNTAILLVLGFASGLPLALTAGTLQAWMADADIDIKTIGFFALVGQAYVFKFLWSPLMDRYVPPLFGRRRGWLLLTQLMLVICIFRMGYIDPVENLYLMAVFAVLVAFSSASQDIAFDAYKTDILTAKDRGPGAAVSTMGYRIAMLVSSGLAMWLAGTYLSWRHTYWLMALLMLLCMLATFLAKEPEIDVQVPRNMQDAIVIPFKDYLGRNSAWIFLLLIIFYKMGDAFAASLSTAFLLRDVGFSVKEIAEVHKTLGIIATIIGVLSGGFLMQRLTLFRALMIFGLLQAISNFGYWILAITSKNILTLTGVIIFENICSGMGTAAFVTLLMVLCNKSFSATQYALLSASASIGRVYVGPVSGWFVASYGWPNFFLFSVLASLPGLFLLFFCRSSLMLVQQTEQFSRRTHFAHQYRFAVILLLIGGFLLLSWLLLLLANSMVIGIPIIVTTVVLQSAAIFALLGMLLGGTLDYLALKRQ